MREKNIIRSLKNGETEYIEYIVSSYYGEIYSYLCRKMGNEIEAQDVTQEVFAKFFANLHIYQERGKLKNYLLKLATNASNDVFRKSRPAITFDEIEELQDTQMTPWEITEQKEEKVRVKQALQALSIHQREVIILRFYQCQFCFRGR